MTFGVLKFQRRFEPLVAISPSRFTSLQQCALREVWSANNCPGLLPAGPAARLGNVIHQLLEAVGKEEIAAGDQDQVHAKWLELIDSEHERMAGNWLERQMVPLSQSVWDFEVRRIRAEARASELAQGLEGYEAKGNKKEFTKEFGYELSYSSPDGLVRGRVDAVQDTGDGPAIQDYKSGALFKESEDGPAILNPAYAVQLKLYAALYFSEIGRWPARLQLVPLQGDPQEVPFDRDRCLELLDEASNTLKEINQIIERHAASSDGLENALASPTPDNCRFCVYRPACSPYRDAKGEPSDGWPVDLWGKVKKIKTLGNSKTVIELESSQILRGIDFRNERHPALDHLNPGDEIAIFNARRTQSKRAYDGSAYTVIYKIEESRRS